MPPMLWPTATVLPSPSSSMMYAICSAWAAIGYRPGGLSLSQCPRRFTETTRGRRTKCSACGAKNERSHAHHPWTKTNAGLPEPRSSKTSLVPRCTIVAVPLLRFFRTFPSGRQQADPSSQTGTHLERRRSRPCGDRTCAHILPMCDIINYETALLCRNIKPEDRQANSSADSLPDPKDRIKNSPARRFGQMHPRH